MPEDLIQAILITVAALGAVALSCAIVNRAIDRGRYDIALLRYRVELLEKKDRPERPSTAFTDGYQTGIAEALDIVKGKKIDLPVARVVRPGDGE